MNKPPKHTKIYLKALGHDLGDPNQYIESELSPKKAVDIHHIISRGKGGEDRIENLMAVTREEHNYYGDKKEWMCFLLNKHREYLKNRGVEFSENWFKDQINKYDDTHVFI